MRGNIFTYHMVTTAILLYAYMTFGALQVAERSICKDNCKNICEVIWFSYFTSTIGIHGNLKMNNNTREGCANTDKSKILGG